MAHCDAVIRGGTDHPINDYLLHLPEENDIAQAIKKAMEAIEEYIPELAGVLPQDEYFRLTRTDTSIPKQLLKNFADIPATASGYVRPDL